MKISKVSAFDVHNKYLFADACIRNNNCSEGQRIPPLAANEEEKNSAQSCRMWLLVWVKFKEFERFGRQIINTHVDIP